MSLIDMSAAGLALIIGIAIGTLLTASVHNPPGYD
jgi:hypothetical protein